MDLAFFKHPDHRGKPAKKGATGCAACGLDRGCRSPRMPVVGEGRKGIFILAEAPGEQEDEQGIQLVGKAGQYLRRKLGALGVDLDRDCWKMNAVGCRTPKGRSPTPAEVLACQPRVWAALREARPKVVIPLGFHGVESLLRGRWRRDKLEGIARWRGWRIPDREFRAWVCPTFHPSYVLRCLNAEERVLAVEPLFEADLDNAVALAKSGEPFPYNDVVRDEELITVVEDERVLRRHLQRLHARLLETPAHARWLAVDVETTGLKPYREGHRIVSCALAWGPDEALAFPWPTGVSFPPLRRLLGEGEFPVIAANLSFEDDWLAHHGAPVRNWGWDTVLAAHVLDNRPKVTSVKFQTYARFGVVDYSEDVDKYLKAPAEEEERFGANAFNRIDEAPFDKLLLYNGLDALYEWRIAMEQMVEVNK